MFFDRRDDDEFYYGGGRKLISPRGIVELLFFPATIIGFLFNIYFLRIKRYKFSFNLILGLIMTVLFSFLSFLIPVSETNILLNILFIYLKVNLICIGPAFILLVGKDCWQLSRYPGYKRVSGWTENFEFRPTFFEERKRQKLINACVDGEAYSDDGAPLGVIDEVVKVGKKEITKPSIVYKYYDESFVPTLLTGTPGSGKSVSMLNQVTNDVKAGHPVVFIDCKNAIDIVYTLSRLAKENGREFYHFAPGRQEDYNNPLNEFKCSYDPFATGSSTYKSETLVNLSRYDASADVYKQRTKTVLQSITYLLSIVDHDQVPQIQWDRGGIYQVYSALKPENLKALINSLQDRALYENEIRENLTRAEELYNALTKAKDDSGLAQQATGARTLLNGLLMSTYGEWLVNKDKKKSIDLFKLTQDEKAPIVLFSLSSLEDVDVARTIGTIILGNIAQVASYRTNQGIDNPVNIYIDEAQNLRIDYITSILSQIRSSNMHILLSMQTLEQVVKEGYPEAEIDALIQNSSNLIVHQGSSTNTATRFSEIFGTERGKSYSVTSKITNNIWTLHWEDRIDKRDIKDNDVDVYRYPPSIFQNLEKPIPPEYRSTAYYITKSCSDPQFYGKGMARRYLSLAPSEITDGVPEEFQRIYNSRKTANSDIKRKKKTIISNKVKEKPQTLKEKKEVDMNKQSELSEYQKKAIRKKKENKLELPDLD